jgi:hypothetical protein
MVTSCYGYNSYWPSAPVEKVVDDRKNRKMWAKWFREFLEDLLGRWRELPLFVPQMRSQNRKKAVARSSPLRFAEWKMKRWKQSLATA